MKHIIESGWHSIRRTLVRLLVNAGLPELTVNDFMRWRRAGSDSMLSRYYTSQVVDEDSGMVTGMGRRDKDVDIAVFDKHPFLSCWAGDNDDEEKVGKTEGSERSNRKK